jgi:hypothetical protein
MYEYAAARPLGSDTPEWQNRVLAASDKMWYTQYGRVVESGIHDRLKPCCLRDCGFESHRDYVGILITLERAY